MTLHDANLCPRRPTVWRYWLIGLLVVTLGLPLTFFSDPAVALTAPPPTLVSQPSQPTLAASRTISATFAWGRNYQGQLGDGTTVERHTPITITMPAGVDYFTQLTGGEFHSLGLGNNGQLYAWGANAQGELGDGTYTSHSTPLTVTMPTGITSFTQVDAGYRHNLALGNNGRLYNWGNQCYDLYYAHANILPGQLDSSTCTNLTPEEIAMPTGVNSFTQFSAGWTHNLEVGDDGQLYAWGQNTYGELGDGSTTTHYTPTIVSLPAGVSRFTQVGAGGWHSLGLGDNGKLYAWGYNYIGQLGDSTTINRTTPVTVTLPAGVDHFTKFAASSWHNLAEGDNGKLYAWGYNGHGELGDGTTTDHTIPVTVTLPSGVTHFIHFAVFRDSNLALGDNGKLYAWGDNSKGQLGDGTTTNHTTPTLVALPTDFQPTSFFHSTNAYNTLVTGNLVVTDTTTTLTSSPADSASYGQNVTFTATVAPIPDGGTATFTFDSNKSVTATVDTATGIATYITNTLSLGQHTVQATFNGTFGYTSSQATPLNLTINQATTTTGLAVAPNPVTVGQNVTFTATVTPLTASGTVTFTLDSATNVTATLSNGKATYVTNTLAIGAHTVSANYGGDNNYLGSNASTQNITVTITTSSLAVEPVSGAYGGTGVLSATLTAASYPVTNQNITFTLSDGVNSKTFTQTTDTNGQAILSTTSLSGLQAGSYPTGVTAAFGGVTGYLASTASNTLTITKVSTGLNLSVDPNPVTVGQNVTFTAMVTPLTASGTVTFTLDSATNVTATLSNGKATYVTNTLAIGAHTVSANYGGDNKYLGSNTADQNFSVIAGCAPLLVTSTSDNGIGDTCGTFSYALTQATTGQTISFTLTTGSTITFTGALTATVPIGVIIDGGTGITLEGNNQSGDGLHLKGTDTLRYLTIRKFAGRALVTDGPGNILDHIILA